MAMIFLYIVYKFGEFGPVTPDLTRWWMRGGRLSWQSCRI